MRTIHIETGINRYAAGSALIKSGHTHVICTATISEKVPDWLRGTGSGWITAEYSMLPSSTHTRSKRDREKISGRTHEIQRLIGRALRSMVDLKKLGERALLIDCDVLQADGGTRVASITGACVATGMALSRLIQEKKIPSEAWVSTVSAMSVGLKNKEVWVDLDYEQDSTCDVDMNFVMTGQGQFVEVQGTGEKTTFSAEELRRMTEIAALTLEKVRETQYKAFQALGIIHPT